MMLFSELSWDWDRVRANNNREQRPSLAAREPCPQQRHTRPRGFIGAPVLRGRYLYDRTHLPLWCAAVLAQPPLFVLLGFNAFHRVGLLQGQFCLVPAAISILQSRLHLNRLSNVHHDDL